MCRHPLLSASTTLHPALTSHCLALSPMLPAQLRYLSDASRYIFHPALLHLYQREMLAIYATMPLLRYGVMSPMVLMLPQQRASRTWVDITSSQRDAKVSRLSCDAPDAWVDTLRHHWQQCIPAGQRWHKSMRVQVSADYVVPHLTLKTVVGLTQNPKVQSASPQHLPEPLFCTCIVYIIVLAIWLRIKLSSLRQKCFRSATSA